LSDPETLAAYNSRTREYAELTAEATDDRALLRFIDRLPVGGTVLDLGCGPGAAAATLHAKGFAVDPVDASARMIELANSTYAIDARQASFDDLDGIEVYDGVWANFSLLHAAPEALPGHLRAIARALKSEGLFHIGMKLGEGTRRDSLGRMYAYYSQDNLLAHLLRAGFENVEIDTGEARGLEGDVEPWITVLSIRANA